MMRLQTTTLCVLLSLVATSQAAATQGESDDEELAMVYGGTPTITLATGSKQSLRRAPAVATVITAEDIAAMGATELDQVLESVPGMHVSRNAVSYTPTYLIRGIGGGGPTNPQVLVLQNGIPMTVAYPGDGGQARGGQPLENIARIEIIRGPGSALYGAEAYAGVINIITRTAVDTQGTTVTAGAGSFNTWDASVRHGGKWGGIDAAAYLRVGSTEGHKEIITADAQTLNDSRFGTRASRAPGPVSTGYDAVDANLDLAYGQWRWRSSWKERNNVHVGAGINSALDPDSTGTSRRLTSDLSWIDPLFAHDWGVGVLASYFHYQEAFPRLMLFPAGTRLATSSFPEGLIGGPSRWDRQIRLSAYATYAGFSGHNLRLGLGHDDIDLYKVLTFKNFLLQPVGPPIPTGPQMDYGDIQPHIPPRRRWIDYLYVQDEWQLARDWTLTAGVRHDRISDVGNTTNPRLALVWDASLDLTAKLLYGEAFRAPALTELYTINPVTSGNPNLRPETIRTLEAALSWQAGKSLQVNLNVFQYDMKDIIRAVPNVAPTPGSTYKNVGAQKGHGLELDVAWDASNALRLSGNYSNQRGVDRTSEADAGYAPHHHVYGRADWRAGANLVLGGQVNRVTNRARPIGDPRPEVANYTSVDLTMRLDRHKSRWALSGAVRNLFNADIREPTLAPGTAIPNDLPMAGRSLYLQLSYRI
ncbi:MAG: TonB-dependent receptor [Pseudomonadota bacterium]